MHGNISRFTTCLAVGVCTGASAASPYFSGVGVLGPDPDGGFSSSRVFGLNADGTVAVGSSTSAGGNRAVRWTVGGGLEALDSLPGAPPQDIANGVSADGTIIFGQSTSALSGLGEATVWTNGTATGLGFVASSPGAQSNIVAMSADGTTFVGLSSNTGLPDFEAAQWNNGIPSALGTGAGSSATAVSADGSVIVGSRTGTGGGLLGAFRWTDQGVIELQDLAAGGLFDLGATALGTSADGSRVIGWATDSFAQRPVMWDAAGNVTDLGLPLGFESGIAVDITPDGDVITGTASGFAGETAFIWTEPTGSMTLIEYLTPHIGSALDGWTLLSADAVSSDGLTFAGVGLDPTGQTQGWVAHVPAPATGVVLGVGVLATFRRRDRTRTRNIGVPPTADRRALDSARG